MHFLCVWACIFLHLFYHHFHFISKSHFYHHKNQTNEMKWIASQFVCVCVCVCVESKIFKSLRDDKHQFCLKRCLSFGRFSLSMFTAYQINILKMMNFNLNGMEYLIHQHFKMLTVQHLTMKTFDVQTNTSTIHMKDAVMLTASLFFFYLIAPHVSQTHVTELLLF